MDEQQLREIYAGELERLGDDIGAALIRRNDPVLGVRQDKAALAAMRRVYLQGRDDANSDAEAALQDT